METNSGTPIPFHVNHGAATRGMLERTVGFLEKRDGVDKVLKIARYSVRLLLATGAVTSPAATRALKDTERGLGSSRKAYRIGKFLRCVGALRKQRRLVPSISSSVLEGTAAVGEGVYYFVDQFQFLVSVGVLSGRQGRHLTKVSSVAELVFCSSDIVLNVLRLRNLLEREVELIRELRRRRRQCDERGQKFDYEDDINVALVDEVNALRKRRFLRTMTIIDDLANAVLAFDDARSAYGVRRGRRTSNVVLGVLGVVSGVVGFWKKFPPAK